jgi:hypothetical protein
MTRHPQTAGVIIRMTTDQYKRHIRKNRRSRDGDDQAPIMPKRYLQISEVHIPVLTVPDLKCGCGTRVWITDANMVQYQGVIPAE